MPFLLHDAAGNYDAAGGRENQEPAPSSGGSDCFVPGLLRATVLTVLRFFLF